MRNLELGMWNLEFGVWKSEYEIRNLRIPQSPYSYWIGFRMAGKSTDPISMQNEVDLTLKSISINPLSTKHMVQ